MRICSARSVFYPALTMNINGAVGMEKKSYLLATRFLNHLEVFEDALRCELYTLAALPDGLEVSLFVFIGDGGRLFGLLWSNFGGG